jgi:hypothetical protein
MIWPGLFDRLPDFHGDLFRNVLPEVQPLALDNTKGGHC